LYDGQGRDRAKIPLIEETIARGHDGSDESQRLARRETRSSEDLRRSILVSAAATVSSPLKKDQSSWESPGASQLRGVTPTQELEQDRPSNISAKSGHSSRPLWNRTRSGSVWYRIQKNTSSQDGKSTRSVPSTTARSDNSAPSPLRVEPLKPPPRPERPQPATTYHIVVDTPFAQAEEQLDSSVEHESINALRTERRRSSIDALKLFSAPLQILRRVVPRKSTKLSSSPGTPIQSEAHRSEFRVRGHKSLLKTDQTGSTLERVASLLEAQKTPKTRRRFGAHPYLKSVSTSSSSEMNDLRQDTAVTVSPTFNLTSSKSSRWASTTSSMLRVQMGSMPQNSPSESATYKVKRSPSAETEEFLKIDISVRGGTSYLPSEARRIYTPPLPEENDTDSRRGYFFDYVAPNAEGGRLRKATLPLQLPRCSKAAASSVVTTAPSVGQELKSDLTTIPVRSSRVPTSNSLRVPPRRAPTTAQFRPGDFYDAKLADIDAIPTDIDVTTEGHEQEQQDQCKRKCPAKIAELKRQHYEAQLDYNIPEHLPSSPLCPRNPRYWRVVRNKGSQFRGCWMHGFGEYDAVPGVKKVFGQQW